MLTGGVSKGGVSADGVLRQMLSLNRSGSHNRCDRYSDLTESNAGKKIVDATQFNDLATMDTCIDYSNGAHFQDILQFG